MSETQNINKAWVKGISQSIEKGTIGSNPNSAIASSIPSTKSDILIGLR